MYSIVYESFLKDYKTRQVLNNKFTDQEMQIGFELMKDIQDYAKQVLKRHKLNADSYEEYNCILIDKDEIREESLLKPYQGKYASHFTSYMIDCRAHFLWDKNNTQSGGNANKIFEYMETYINPEILKYAKQKAESTGWEVIGSYGYGMDWDDCSYEIFFVKR